MRRLVLAFSMSIVILIAGALVPESGAPTQLHNPDSHQEVDHFLLT